MQVKKAFWEKEKSGESSLSALDDLVGSLDEQRLYREVTLALRTGHNDSIINLFIHTQSIPSLQ
ncbi:hypothetical protein Tco_0028986, partial [Tanacetum coccineum]